MKGLGESDALKVGHKTLNPIDNIENVVVEILVSVDMVHVERQLVLNSMEDILNWSINRIIWCPKSKSMT